MNVSEGASKKKRFSGCFPGILLSINASQVLFLFLLVFIFTGLGDPIGPDPVTAKEQGLARAKILVITALFYFLLSLVFAFIWYKGKRIAGYFIATFSFIHLGFSYYVLYEFFYEVFRDTFLYFFYINNQWKRRGLSPVSSMMDILGLLLILIPFLFDILILGMLAAPLIKKRAAADKVRSEG